MSKVLSNVLRIEGFCLFIVCLILYAKIGPGYGWHWKQFLILCLIPDLSMFGYLAGSRIGEISYNFTHSTIVPFLVIIIGFAQPNFLIQNHGLCFLGLIWLAHIGIDRALGYGLKSIQGFSYTHLGKIGKKRYN